MPNDLGSVSGSGSFPTLRKFLGDDFVAQGLVVPQKGGTETMLQANSQAAALPSSAQPLVSTSLPVSPSEPKAVTQSANKNSLDESAALDLLDQIIQEQKSKAAQSPTVSSAHKESLARSESAPEQQPAVAPEVAPTPEKNQEQVAAEKLQVELAEQELAEINKELEQLQEKPEVSAEQQFQEKNRQLIRQAPQDGVSTQPVVIIPMSQASANKAARLGPKYSLRWLWEWCKKVAKIFHGAVVYNESLAQDES